MSDTSRRIYLWTKTTLSLLHLCNSSTRIVWIVTPSNIVHSIYFGRQKICFDLLENEISKAQLFVLPYWKRHRFIFIRIWKSCNYNQNDRSYSWTVTWYPVDNLRSDDEARSIIIINWTTAHQTFSIIQTYCSRVLFSFLSFPYYPKSWLGL